MSQNILSTRSIFASPRRNKFFSETIKEWRLVKTIINRVFLKQSMIVIVLLCIPRTLEELEI